MPTGLRALAGAGTQPSALSFGGTQGPNNVATTQVWTTETATANSKTLTTS